MPNSKQHKEIDPQLESILKEELCNRAEKLQKIDKWKKQNRKDYKQSYALGGIAAAVVIGFFIIQPMMTREDNVGSTSTGQIFRGSFVAPTIIEAIESGNKEAAIKMIDSCFQECTYKLDALDTITISPEMQQEVEEQRFMLRQEQKELDSLKYSLQCI